MDAADPRVVRTTPSRSQLNAFPVREARTAEAHKRANQLNFAAG